MSPKYVTKTVLVLTTAICASSACAQGLETCELARLSAGDDPKGIIGFGGAVAISGDYVLVGATGDRDAGINAGAAYLFKRQGTSWVEHLKFTSLHLMGQEVFGWSVAIDGDLLVVGAPNLLFSQGIGSAYVFRREGATWVEEATLVSSGSSQGDWFGLSVSISGERVAVGAPEEGFSIGRAYVFRREGTTWIEEAALLGSEIVSGDIFGTSVAIDSDLLVVGAERDDDAGEEAGTAYVFTREGGTWVQQAKLVAGDPGAMDHFGGSVAIDGDDAMVAAKNNDDLGTNAGSVYVFRRKGLTWAQQAKLTASDPGSLHQFGASMAIEGNLIVVGASGHAHAGALSGAAYVFRRDTEAWLEQERLIASDAGMHRQFGSSLAIDGDYAVIGPGSAYLFAIGADCNANGLTDACEVADGTAPDCNGNAIPDDCDIAAGTSQDTDGDGMPDECPRIPAVSHWGLVTLGLLMIVGATIRLLRVPIDLRE